jgi:hypothetical protein
MKVLSDVLLIAGQGSLAAAALARALREGLATRSVKVARSKGTDDGEIRADAREIMPGAAGRCCHG